MYYYHHYSAEITCCLAAAAAGNMCKTSNAAAAKQCKVTFASVIHHFTVKNVEEASLPSKEETKTKCLELDGKVARLFSRNFPLIRSRKKSYIKNKFDR